MSLNYQIVPRLAGGYNVRLCIGGYCVFTVSDRIAMSRRLAVNADVSFGVPVSEWNTLLGIAADELEDVYGRPTHDAPRID